MDQRAFEEYVLDLLFVALKQRDKPVWEITPVISLLSVASDFLAHSYFASSYPLLSDIYELLSDDKPAAKRFALTPKTNTDGTYYMFKAWSCCGIGLQVHLQSPQRSLE